jgi:hypothetical protein
MKKWVITFIVALPCVVNAQVFHFINTSTTLVKDITQSPAHWYIEIYNDLNVEDTLRWKAHFVSVPPQWDINFDTQSGYWHPVLDGDSADFLLLDSLSFPQKLIIGNATNLTAGHGSVFFDIYDPNNPTDLVTIEYEFIITDNIGLDEEMLVNSMLITKDWIQFDLAEPGNYILSNTHGQILKTGSTETNCDVSTLSPGLYVIQLQIGEKKLVKKFVR